MTTSFKKIRKERLLASLDDSDKDVIANDDEAEKLRRRREKVINNAHSSPKRLSIGLQTTSNGMSNEMLVEHYSKCIQLSTENKITVKNAFALHLIDYMAEMIKRKDSQLNNFQVASCTLDASTKIYSYRVDCVHTDTLKIVSNISRTRDDKGSKRNNEEMGSGNEDVDDSVQTKKKRVKRGRTIETNLKNINTTKIDVQAEVDPVMKKISSKFLEEGSTTGAFLTSLHHFNEDYGLILSSQAPFLFRPTVDNVDTMGSDEQDITDLHSLLGNIKKGSRICTAFDGFSFESWNVGDKMPYDKGSEKVSESDVEDDNDFNSPNNFIDDFNEDVDSNQQSENLNNLLNDQPVSETLFDKIDPEGLKRVLSLDHNEYSYFKPQFLSAWAGPNHWHIRPRLKTKSEDIKKPKIIRVKKPPLVLEFSLETDVEKYFKKSKMGNCLAKNTISSWYNKETVIPQDNYYDGKLLLQLFLNKSVTIQFRKELPSQDNNLDDYNYENANDVDNYCPPSDFARDSPTRPYNDLDDISKFPMSQTLSLEDDDRQNIFTGENLIDKPFQVPKFEIPYPRAAKIVNVKRLKHSMWAWISEEETEPINKKPKLFFELYNELPNLVTEKTAKNLSIPIALNCLLHLANDKVLQIQSTEAHDDLVILMDKLLDNRNQKE